MKNREIKFKFIFKDEETGKIYLSTPFDMDDLLTTTRWSYMPTLSEFPDFDGDSIYDLSRIGQVQFTGLHDKNGKEIYDGDIVVLPGGNIKSVIKYYDGAYHFSFEEFDINPIRQDRTKRWEVIGNIHQHPDLLK